jgi:hypothetical protein
MGNIKKIIKNHVKCCDKILGIEQHRFSKSEARNWRHFEKSLEELKEELKIEEEEDKAAKRWEVGKIGDRMFRQDILKHLPELMKQQQIVIWCRHGDICPEATICKTLSCGFKKNKDDIVNGVSKCQYFQITKSSSKGWYDAERLDFDWAERYR